MKALCLYLHMVLFVSKFEKMKLGHLVEICFWLNLAVNGLKEVRLHITYLFLKQLVIVSDVFSSLCCPMRICIHCRKWYAESFHRNRLLWSYSSLLYPGNLFSYVFFICIFITSAERKVKNSCHPGMSQSCFFGDKIGHPKFVGCRLLNEVRAELIRDISSSRRFLWFIQGRKNYYFGFPGVWTDSLMRPVKS